MDLDEILEDLQIRLAYQEDMIQSLNQTIAAQDQDILWLKRQCRQWEERFKALSENAQGRLPEEKPPHY